MTFLLFLNFMVCGQDNYELLNPEHDFEQILSTARKKSSADDYYWLSLVLNKQGKTLKSIQVLEERIKKSEDNQKLDLMISDLYYESRFFPGKGYLNSPEPEKGLYYHNLIDSLV